ncbi:hypothetical protein [Massilia oculi]|uniref:hypothetical protein n=1 Tax=Massilia oculi TaxID=945844 RepID=UPI0028AAFE55|nr:hypothetical protein [Massilia oculi]
MTTSDKLKRSLGFRLFWLGFGLLLGVPQLLDGIMYGMKGELFFGIGMLLVGIRGFLRPVVLGRAMTLKRDDSAEASSIGSTAVHGMLSLAMAASLFAGLAIKLGNS